MRGSSLATSRRGVLIFFRFLRAIFDIMLCMYLYEDRHEEYTDLLLLCKSYLTNIKAPSDLKSPLLIAGLNDTDWEVRKRATKLLGLLGDPVYRDRLIAVLNS